MANQGRKIQKESPREKLPTGHLTTGVLHNSIQPKYRAISNVTRRKLVAKIQQSSEAYEIDVYVKG